MSKETGKDIENFFETNTHNTLCDSFPNEVFFS